MPVARWVVFDTNVYVTALREGVAGASFGALRAMVPRTYLASVVSAELRAGAVDETGRAAVLDLTAPFERVGRVVTPDARSWNRAGDALAEICRREPRLRSGIRRLWNDALIALSAGQVGATLVTGNVEDFELLRRYVPFELQPLA
jgi:predicted nucleic acid-binding protein